MDAGALAPAREAPVAAFGIAVTASVALHLGALGLVAPFAYGVAPLVVEPPQRLEVVLVAAARPPVVPDLPAIASAAAPAVPTKPVAVSAAPHAQARHIAPPVSHAPSAEAARAASRPEPQPETVRAPSRPDSQQDVAADAPHAPEEPLRDRAPPVLQAAPARLAAPAPVQVAVPAPAPSPASARGTADGAATAGASIASAGAGAGAGAAAAAAAPAATAVAYLDTPPPAYPESARRDGMQGLTVVEVLVSKTGAPLDVRVTKTSGVAALDGAAVAGVREWRFTPATRDHEPIDARITIPIRFRLDGES